MVLILIGIFFLSITSKDLIPLLKNNYKHNEIVTHTIANLNLNF